MRKGSGCLAAESSRSLGVPGLVAHATLIQARTVAPSQTKHPAGFSASDTRPLGVCWGHKFWLLLHQIKSLIWHLGAIKRCWGLPSAVCFLCPVSIFSIFDHLAFTPSCGNVFLSLVIPQFLPAFFYLSCPFVGKTWELFWVRLVGR